MQHPCIYMYILSIFASLIAVEVYICTDTATSAYHAALGSSAFC